MKRICAGSMRGWIVACVLLAGGPARAATHYVWTNSPSANPPYTNWTSASHTIQDALDAAGNGDTIMVTNGLYLLTASVMVTNPVTLRSVNGAASTVVDGNGPVTSNRCFSLLASNVTLEGFTVTNGNPTDDDYGGGVLVYGTGVVIRSCRIVGNVCGDEGGGGLGLKADGTVVDGCLIADNAAEWGGGVTVTDGGALLQNTVIVGNRAVSENGGGVTFSIWGYTGTLHNCFISGNDAAQDGGGVELGAGELVMRQCTLSGNTAGERGGGLTVNGPSASNVVVRNSVIYHNQALREPNYHAAFWDDSVFRSDATCTTPLPDGTGNIAGPPGLLSPYDPHIVSNSICLHAGDNGYAVGALDIDGEPRTNGVRVDIGCDEFWAAGMTGEIAVAIQLFPSNAVLTYPIEFTSLTEGRVGGYAWDFGDGQMTSDVCVVSHTYAATGHYDVVLSAWNNDSSNATTVRVQVVEGYTNYVATGGGHVPPFISWADAATTIQAAVDANTYAGGVTLVAAGTYDQGGAVYGPTNRVAIVKPLSVLAADSDPSHTVIVGNLSDPTNATRCAYLRTGALLAGFTLTGGSGLDTGGDVDQNGGGVLCHGGGTVSNCIVTGNLTWRDGGGVALRYGGSVVDCTLSGNVVTNYAGGGGLYIDQAGWASGCTIVSNRSQGHGGGVYLNGGGTISNCTVAANTTQSKGAGLYIAGAGEVHHSTVQHNRGRTHGAGIFLINGGIVKGCLIADNVVTLENWSGGGVGVQNDGLVADSIIRRNSASTGGGVILLYTGGVVSNCVVEQNWGQTAGGGINCYRGGLVTHCEVRDNMTGGYGGGVRCYEGGAVRDSLLERNAAQSRGGGIEIYKEGEATRCVIRNNVHRLSGAGVSLYRGGHITNCVIAANQGGRGAGLYIYRDGVAESCTIAHNRSVDGAEGGGVYGNSGGILVNSIVYDNEADSGPNYGGSLTWTNGCTTPDPVVPGVITNAPQFLYAPGAEYRLAAGSPCINAGTNQPWMAAGIDLDGDPRLVNDIVDLGAYEVGALTCGFTADPAQGVAPMTVDFTGYAAGTNLTGLNFQWDFEDDGTVDAEGPGMDAVQTLYANEGLYPVRLVVSNAAGESTTCLRTNYVVALVSNVHYVAHTGAHSFPYTSWASAANDIQSAVIAAAPGARVVVADGTYTNVIQVTVDKPITVHSENGPATTVIDGWGTHRGFWVAAGGLVHGFTVTNGYGYVWISNGGGVFLYRGGTVSNCVLTGGTGYGAGFGIEQGGLLTDCVVSNNTTLGNGAGGRIRDSGTVMRCRIVDNAADGHGGGVHIQNDGTVRDSIVSNNTADSYGGGVYCNGGGLIDRCTIVSNRATWLGGGIHAREADVMNCLIVGNEGSLGGGVSAGDLTGDIRNCTIVMNTGGGTESCTIQNSIVYGNTPTNYDGGAFSTSCTTPLPGGTGNTAANPLLAADYRLITGSPCIDTGADLAGITHDRDGVSRPLDGDNDGTATMDMGCYEFVHATADSDGDSMLDLWEVGHHLDPTNAVDADADWDGDGSPNRDEHVADTDPWDDTSVFRISGMELGSSFTVTFACTNSRIYALEGCPSLTNGQWSGVSGQTNLWGEIDGEMSLTDPNPSPLPAYRATVKIP